MHRKAILWLFFVGVSYIGWAQEVSEKERDFVLTQLYYPTPGLSLNYTVTNEALNEEKVDYATYASIEKDIEKRAKKLKGKPEDAPLYSALAEAYTAIFEEVKADSCWREAIRHYQQWYALSPNDETVAAGLAEAYAQRKQFQKAIQVYQSLLEKQPNQYTYLKGLAEVYQRMGDMAAYQAQCEKLIVLDEDSQAGHYGKVMTMYLENVQQVRQTAEAPTLARIVPKGYLMQLTKKYSAETSFALLNESIHLMGLSEIAFGQLSSQASIENMTLTTAQQVALQTVKTFFQNLSSKTYKNEVFVSHSLMIVAFLEKDLTMVKQMYGLIKQLSPYYLENYLDALCIAMAFKDNAFALEVLQDKAKIYAESIDQLFEARQYFEKEDFNRASTLTKTFLKTNQTNIFAQLALTVLQLKAGQFVQAKAQLYAVARLPKDSYLQHHYWYVHALYDLLRNNREAAKAKINRILTNAPKNERALLLKDNI